MHLKTLPCAIKARAIWLCKGDALVSHKNFCHLKKTVCHYKMKIILSDAESREKHGVTKYGPIGQKMAELWTFLCQGVVEINEN